MFEWDPAKAAANAVKHGVSFEEAATVFADGDALDGPAIRHFSGEPRLFRLGRSAFDRVLFVAYTLRRHDDGETVRIISARKASRKERAAYARGD